MAVTMLIPYKGMGLVLSMLNEIEMFLTRSTPVTKSLSCQSKVITCVEPEDLTEQDEVLDTVADAGTLVVWNMKELLGKTVS